MEAITREETPVELATVAAADGHPIPCRVWRPDAPPRAVVQVCHGMAEHAGRYDEFARTLVASGMACVAHDHRGHGRNTDMAPPGHFADSNGWQKVLADVDTVRRWIDDSYPDRPVFLLGHSMGSFIVQSYLVSTHPAPRLAGLVLSGSNLDKVGRLRALRPLLSAIRLFSGARGNSRLLYNMTFGAFSKSVKAAATPYDWLSTDAREVRAYIDDQRCGFQCTVQLWQDLSEGLIQISNPANLKNIEPDLPIHILAGDRDPVGALGAGPRRLAQAYRDSGHRDVSLRLYPNMRHETFHETERQQVFRDLIEWFGERLPPSS